MTDEESPSKETPGNYVLVGETGRFHLKTFAPTLIQASDPNAVPGFVTVKTPSFDSVGWRGNNGEVSVSGSGQPDIGRPGEARVAEQLIAIWRAQACNVQLDAGDDHRGVDRWLRFPDRSLALQVVTVPRDPQYWYGAVTGRVELKLDADGACLILRDAIESKGSMAAPGETVLALDALHAGPLSSTPIHDRYLSRFGCPSAEFSFASVWIVGPAAEQVRRLGGGFP